VTIAECQDGPHHFIALVPSFSKDGAINAVKELNGRGGTDPTVQHHAIGHDYRSTSISQPQRDPHIGEETTKFHPISSSDGQDGKKQQPSSSKDISSSNSDERVWGLPPPADGTSEQQEKQYGPSRPSYLRNDELKILHEYVKGRATKLHEGLDEDAIGIRMVRTDHVIKERVSSTADPEADSEEEEDRISQAPSYRKEMDFLLKQDFFKQVAKDTNAANFHKRTIYWLKKEMGLSRRNEVRDLLGGPSSLVASKADNESEDDDKDTVKPRLTRTMARNTRIKKREERQSTREDWGLNALTMAANDVLIELDLSEHEKQENVSMNGLVHSQPQKKQQKKDQFSKKRSRQKKVNPEEALDLSCFIRVSKWMRSRGQRAAMNLDRKLEIRVASIVVGGTNIEPELREYYRDDEASKMIRHVVSRKSKRPRIYQLTSDDEEETVGEIAPNIPVPAPSPKVKPKKRGRTMMTSSRNAGPSLSLQDWRKRQRCRFSHDNDQESSVYENGELEPVIQVSNNLQNSGIELPQWETINPLSNMTRRPSMVDPTRRVESDHMYASWCTKLIHCLNGRGRSFARHEFFYSDIDRPWFNFDSFRVDLAKRGISPDARFSRSEWSIIRQQIRKRPRLFSKAFVAEELTKLRQYRSTIWAMQHEELPRPEGFLFEVPRPINAGTTVTALHRGIDILHRGVVLAYDKSRAQYLVQFERKELGFGFCPDHEVASHGVPQLLPSPSACALDGAKIGGFVEQDCPAGATDYGTAYALVERATKVRRNGLSSRIRVQKSGLDDKTGEALLTGSSSRIMEKVAEREILIKLTETIEMSMKRKSLLLDAIEDFQKTAVANLEAQGEPRSKEFADHYAWLRGNLDLTSKSLEAALTHLRVMYGNAQDGNQATEAKLAQDHHELIILKRIEPTLTQDRVRSDLYSPWAAALVTNARNMGVDMSSISFGDPQRQSFFESRLEHAQELLICAEYAGKCKKPMGDGGSSMTNAVASVLETNMGDLETAAIAFPRQVDCSSQRESALQILKDAVGNYNLELAALLAKELPHKK